MQSHWLMKAIVLKTGLMSLRGMPNQIRQNLSGTRYCVCLSTSPMNISLLELE